MARLACGSPAAAPGCQRFPAGPQPHNIYQKECQKICQKKCQKICQKICHKEGQKECPKMRQKEGQKICHKKMSEDMSKRMSERMTENMSERMSENMPERSRKCGRIETARGELEASGRGSSHGQWELWGVSLATQNTIEEFAHKPGEDGRSRGGDKEAEEETEEGVGDKADIKPNNPHPTDTQQG